MARAQELDVVATKAELAPGMYDARVAALTWCVIGVFVAEETLCSRSLVFMADDCLPIVELLLGYFVVR